MSNRLKLAVGLPAYGDALTAHHARMWTEFGSTLGGSAERFALVMFAHVDINPIDKARNELLAMAIKAQADWLLMIDADTWIEPRDESEDAGQQILRMISDAERAEASIVCAPVVRRRMHADQFDEFMIYRKQPGSTKADQLKPMTRRDPDPTDLASRRLFQVDACATACFAINVPRTMHIDEPFRFAHGLSEDLYACNLVRETGGKIFCDPRVRTGHKSRAFGLYSR